MPTHFFHLNSASSPTYYNLCLYLSQQHWHKTPFNFLAHFSEKNFQFDVKAAEQLEFKDLLAELTKEYCEEVMPLTYCIHDENWQNVLNQAAKTPDKVWILKPALLNNGQHIHLFQHLSQLKAHYLSSNRLGGSHVLQEYITPPHLLKGPSEGHKYSLRMFVVLTNYHGAYL